MLGSSLLVAPVLQHNRDSVKVYFPKGTWYSLQHNAPTASAIIHSDGGKDGWRTVPAPIGQVPVYTAGQPCIFCIVDPCQQQADMQRLACGHGSHNFTESLMFKQRARYLLKAVALCRW